MIVLKPKHLTIIFLSTNTEIPKDVLYGWNEAMALNLLARTFEIYKIIILKEYLELYIKDMPWTISINMLTDESKTKVTKYLFEEKVLHLIKHK